MIVILLGVYLLIVILQGVYVLMSGLDLERLCLAASPVGLMQVERALALTKTKTKTEKDT